ncbi:serine/threonine-protein kinase [Thermopolyspora sp. NPDC052614]|uniref:serine/threonine-protein kinase n=1 Tax=Thermopolyspora sp. NPDC052614 TaxID=3155682 RepID=UPI00342C90FE
MSSSHLPDPGESARIGDYRLIRVLGEGGQGMVYLARAPDGRDVAVKVLHAQLTGDADARRRFLRESEVVRRVAPFCTARVLDVGMYGERPYIVSEYVPGVSLDRVVRQQGPRTGGALERLAVATASALAAIHRAGVVHRDFKPSNVILGPEGPVVIDFGLSRSLDHSGTLTGRVGTPAYMAPEQFTGVGGQPADVFAWAGTMIFAATGHRAFRAETVPALLHAIVHREPDLTGVPAEILAVVSACLAKDPAVRPTAAELLVTLTGDAVHLPPVALPPVHLPAQPHPAPVPPGPVPPEEHGSPASRDETAPLASPVRRRIAGRAVAAIGVALVAAVALAVPLWPRNEPAGPGVGTFVRSSGTPDPVPFGSLVYPPLTEHGNDVRSVALGRLDGTPIAVTGSDDETARVWDLRAGRQLGRPLTGHTAWVRSVAFGEVDGEPVVVTVSDDDSLRVWNPRTGEQDGAPLTGHDADVKGVALGRLDGTPIAVTAGADGTARVWDLRTRRQIGDPFTGHRGRVWAVAVGELNGVPVAVTTGDDGTARVWDLRTRRQIGDPLTGHDGWVRSVALGRIDGRAVAVTGGEDRTVRVWDLATGRQRGEPLRGHPGPVWSVAVGDDGGVPIAVSGGEGAAVRVWDLRTGERLGPPLSGHGDHVWAVATGELDGTPVAVTGSRDETVRVWSLATVPPSPSSSRS